MIIEVSRTWHFNLGSYEFGEASAKVTMDSKDYPDRKIQDLLKIADNLLDDALRSDLERANRLTTESNSFVHEIIREL